MQDSEIPKSIELPVWWSPGTGVSYLREGLPPNHPEHPYNYVRRVYNVDPELFNIFHPYKQKYEHWTRDQLMSKVCELEGIISKMEY